MPKLMLDRQTLARLLQNDHQAIVAFEKVLGDVGDALPSTLEEVTALASMASSLANMALEILAKTDGQLELLRGLPTPVAPPVDENYIPAISLGTIAQQNAESVDITGGTISGVTITGDISGNAATATALQTARTINGVSFNGTANITIVDATRALLAGSTSQAFATSTLDASDVVTVTKSSGGATVEVLSLENSGGGVSTKASIGFYAAGTKYSEIKGGYGAASPEITVEVSGTQELLLNAAGAAINAGFGCNTKAAQTPYTLGAAATDLASVITLANNLRTMSINNGIGQN